MVINLTDLARSARLWMNQRTPVLRAPTMKLAKDIAIATCIVYHEVRDDMYVTMRRGTTTKIMRMLMPLTLTSTGTSTRILLEWFADCFCSPSSSSSSSSSSSITS